jgi:hypothetical protein
VSPCCVTSIQSLRPCATSVNTVARVITGEYGNNTATNAKGRLAKKRIGPILIGRDDWIRTSDPLTPSQVRYQAALHPESFVR